ncbi:MAG: alkyl hydroperoxide reductase/Thiol specific antioxidant/Mal allergen [Betaproteobacteria bacterium]|nr:alkyl hydroperoxide reductase/Thiol specific antioxidant/Mal allergen [Betaproteobacteria bacterium]
MFRIAAPALISLFSAALISVAHAAAAPGQPAPDFTLTTTEGKPAKLSDYKGKWVVLEWTNPGCPFVQRHYGAKNMQGLQQEFGGKQVVWLSVNSTNPDNPDYLKPAALDDWMHKQGAAQKAVLMDEKGEVGRAYGARTTPQMVVITPEGKLSYNGAIDDKRAASMDETKTAHNYVRAALTEGMAGKPVAVAVSTPYGCSIKY